MMAPVVTHSVTLIVSNSGMFSLSSSSIGNVLASYDTSCDSDDSTFVVIRSLLVDSNHSNGTPSTLQCFKIIFDFIIINGFNQI
jgi:hypothetical protein